MNVMAYERHNPGGERGSDSVVVTLADAKTEIDYWVRRGVSKDKAVFGVPFYGYSWAPGRNVQARPSFRCRPAQYVWRCRGRTTRSCKVARPNFSGIAKRRLSPRHSSPSSTAES